MFKDMQQAILEEIAHHDRNIRQPDELARLISCRMVSLFEAETAMLRHTLLRQAREIEKLSPVQGPE